MPTLRVAGMSILSWVSIFKSLTLLLETLVHDHLVIFFCGLSLKFGRLFRFFRSGDPVARGSFQLGLRALDLRDPLLRRRQHFPVDLFQCFDLLAGRSLQVGICANA